MNIVLLQVKKEVDPDDLHILKIGFKNCLGIGSGNVPAIFPTEFLAEFTAAFPTEFSTTFQTEHSLNLSPIRNLVGHM